MQAPSPGQGPRGPELSQRVALVTGASKGVGLAVVRQFVASGATVVMVDSQEDLLQAAVMQLGGNGHQVLPITGDVSHKAAVDFMIQQAINAYGKLDILVCCSDDISLGALEDVDINAWEHSMRSNLTGPFICLQTASGYMKQQGYGRIVNVAAQASKTLGCFGGVHYHASKAGILGLTRQAAKELGEYGITVNCVCPGAIDTPEFHNAAAQSGHLKLNTPLKRLGTVDEVANVVSFLAGDLAGYVTGASYDVNGGDVMC